MPRQPYETPFVDKYDEVQTLRRSRHGWKIQKGPSETIRKNQAIAPLVAAAIKRVRTSRGLTLKEFATQLGWLEGNPKERVWAMENCSSRGEGVRLGTLFHIANTFGLEIRDLIPTNAEILAALSDTEGGY